MATNESILEEELDKSLLLRVLIDYPQAAWMRRVN